MARRISRDGTRRGLSEGSQKALKQNRKPAEPNNSLAAVHHGYSKQPKKVEFTLSDGRVLTYDDVAQIIEKGRERTRALGPDAEAAHDLAKGNWHLIRGLRENPNLDMSAQILLAKREEMLQKQLESILQTPASQLKHGLPERLAAEEHRANPVTPVDTAQQALKVAQLLDRIGALPNTPGSAARRQAAPSVSNPLPDRSTPAVKKPRRRVTPPVDKQAEFDRLKQEELAKVSGRPPRSPSRRTPTAAEQAMSNLHAAQRPNRSI